MDAGNRLVRRVEGKIEMTDGGNGARIRDHYAPVGWRLFRNNSGVLPDKRGVPVRFGLGNETAAINKLIKSHDYIGWAPTLILPDMVGDVIARFVSIEAKPDGWTFPRETNRDAFAHCDAQRRWARMVQDEGGIAGFMIDPARGFEPC
jgi:hypothetical protein